jgi:MraZ protein
MRFLGNIEAKTDAKGRVFLPSMFRKELMSSGDASLVMRKDVHKQCLVLYPESSWNRRMDEMFAKADEWDEQESEALRMYMSDVELLGLDGNGRLLIPRRYLDDAGISQSVRFIGMYDKIEIWSPDKLAQPSLSQETFANTLKVIMNRSL